jgi:colanic acid biosynthesis protein WcaH
MNSLKTQFLNIIDATPLVSVDLVIENKNREVLLGKRVNRPAKGYWFVPGGRIRKNEKVRQAIKRVSRAEIGLNLSTHRSELLGAYDHIYEDNYYDADGVNTHYVVLAFLFRLENDINIVSDTQHSEMKWWPVNDLLDDDTVHPNTKVYFNGA